MCISVLFGLHIRSQGGGEFSDLKFLMENFDFGFGDLNNPPFYTLF